MLLVGVLWFANPRALVAVIADADLRWLLAGFFLSVLSNVVSALRWRELTAWLGHPVPEAVALRLYFRAMALNALLPGGVVGGDIYRAVALRREGMDGRMATLSVLLDRGWGFWVIIAISAIATPFAWASIAAETSWVGGLPQPSIPLFVAAGMLWIVLPLPLLLRLAPKWRPLQGGHTSGVVRQYVLQSIASLGVQWFSVGALALGARAIHLDLPFMVWAMVSFPIFLLAAVPVSWGGWGTRETAAVVALSIFGVSAAEGAGVGMIYGIYALAQAGVGALLFGGQTLREAAGSSH